MKRLTLRATPEIVTLAVLLVLSLLGLIFLHGLVAPPKLLFGRSLSAIAPSLFPSIILASMALLCTGVLVQLNLKGGHEVEAGLSPQEWQRGAVFFGIMTLYALTMQPIGFLISSVTAVVLLSLHMGNRSVVQIALLALLGPVLLYLASTRLLAVSLPELNLIELGYARLLGE
jgi:putative tricarboxylic transport membrane protein